MTCSAGVGASSDVVKRYREMADALLRWYAVAQRDLPWRRTRDSYAIWVSEIMLQQTQVATVLPYYERFMARFPTVRALAGAQLDEVLALWQGLGYYTRARSLHAAARRVCDLYDGNIPHQRTALRALPGIGDYTAGAVLSIAFGLDEVAVDGNVVRVLCRLFDVAEDPARGATRLLLRRHAEGLLPSGRAGDYNQAMMELGAVICLPRAPQCLLCPLTSYCRARELGVHEQRPLPRVRAEIPHRSFAAAICERDGRLLLVRRQPSGLLGGLWEFPQSEILEGQNGPDALHRALEATLGMQVRVGAQVAIIKHAYTHFRLTTTVYRCLEESGEPAPGGEWDRCHWLSPGERDAYGLTGVATRILAALAHAKAT
jgi:A/G-specific adenine glycosylase